MGTSLKTLSPRATLVADESTWIEDEAIRQLKHSSTLEGMQRVCGMPDLHPGRGYPVGAAFFSVGRLHPALVGNDIGCGMALWQTGLSAARSSASKLDRWLGNLDRADPASDETLSRFGPHASAIGTIGGGNHFAEFQRIDRIDDPQAVAALGLDRERLLLLVHSGSRGLGEAILREHLAVHGALGLDQDSDSAATYLQRHDLALRFASENRRRIATRILGRVRSSGAAVLDVNHNFVEATTVDGQAGWLHRKGATPADRGPVVIPGSRGDWSYLVSPLPSPATLDTLAHGAGRKWQRGDCKGRLERRWTVESLRRTDLGSQVICEDRALIWEEAPQAYKAIDSVVGALFNAGLIRILARLRPVLSYKTRGGHC